MIGVEYKTTFISTISLLEHLVSRVNYFDRFGDEMMDVTTHAYRIRHHQHGFKYKVLLIMDLEVLTILAYYHQLSDLGVRLPTE